MSWNRIKIGLKVPDVFIMNLDFSDFSKLASMSHPKEFQVKVNNLQNKIEKLFKNDDRFLSTWAGDGFIVLFRDNNDYADVLIEKSLKIIKLIQAKNKMAVFKQPIIVRIGINMGNITLNKDIGKIAGSAMNLAGHLQKYCPDVGGVLLRGQIANYVKNKNVLNVFSLKTVYIKGEPHQCYYCSMGSSAGVSDVIGHSDNIVLNLEELFSEKAIVEKKNIYLSNALKRIGQSKEITLTGAAPVWLYLVIAKSLHGRVSKLMYNSPTSGNVTIFDHSQTMGSK